MSIEPDTKDWTWVLQRACPECGFDAVASDRAGLADAVARNAQRMRDRLAGDPSAALRPDSRTWSLLEYAAHVRDVHLVFAERLALMLERDAPVFANWDQDEAARLGRYREQDPAQVAAELAASGARFARALAAVPDDAWPRTGRRSNGSQFTVDTLARYALHDLVHHWYDVSGERSDPPPRPARIPTDFLDLLREPAIAALATIRSDGAPSVTPMWFLWEDGRLLLTHTTRRAKVAELTARPLATLLVIDPANPSRYLQIRTRLAGIEPDSSGALYVRLAARYGAADPQPPADAADRVIIALEPIGVAARSGA